LAIGSFVSSPAGAVAVLTGSTVSAQGFFPDLITPFSPPTAPVVVGGGVEIPGGTITPGRAFGFDVSATQIEYFAAENNHYGDAGPGGFNGFVLTFAGAPTITSITLNGATNLTPVAFSSTGNTVTLNYNDQVVALDSITVLDVSFASATVPEPATWMTLLAGFGLLGFATRRRPVTKGVAAYA
jgi:PEP-CTERM motif